MYLLFIITNSLIGITILIPILYPHISEYNNKNV